MGQELTPPESLSEEGQAEQIKTQEDLVAFCLQVLKQEATEVEEDFGLHMVDDYLDNKQQELILTYGEVDHPIARKRLDIVSAIDEARLRLK